MAQGNASDTQIRAQARTHCKHDDSTTTAILPVLQHVRK
jgi:hypothetical protein